MENNKLKEYISIRKVDGKVFPIAQLTQEKEFLPGFIWKPEDRPKSKEDLLNRKRILTKTAETKTDTAKSDRKNDLDIDSEIETDKNKNQSLAPKKVEKVTPTLPETPKKDSKNVKDIKSQITTK